MGGITEDYCDPLSSFKAKINLHREYGSGYLSCTAIASNNILRCLMMAGLLDGGGCVKLTEVRWKVTIQRSKPTEMTDDSMQTCVTALHSCFDANILELVVAREARRTPSMPGLAAKPE